MPASDSQPTIEQALATRLAHARLTAALTQGEVATALGIPRSAVSLMESGQRAVSSVELARLAQLYGRPVDELLVLAGEGRDNETAVMRYFRAAGELAPATERRLEEAEVQWRRYASLEARTYGAQRYELPRYPVPPGRPYEQGERLAMQERRRRGLGIAPIRSVITLLEDEGVKVLMLSLGTQAAVSGCYFFSDELGPCVLINQDELASRRRFTASHEYCHFLVDRGVIEGEVCSHTRRKEPFEQRANSFAASFLLPAAGIEQTLSDMGAERGRIASDDLVHLAYRFGASYEAVSWRLVNLGWISSAQRQSYAEVASTDLAKSLGYGDNVPGDTEPSPTRLQKVALDAWRSGHLDRDELAEELRVSAKDVDAMFGHVLSGTHRAPKRQPVEDPDWF